MRVGGSKFCPFDIGLFFAEKFLFVVLAFCETRIVLIDRAFGEGLGVRELVEGGLRARLLIDDAHTPHVINIIKGNVVKGQINDWRNIIIWQ